MDTSKNDGNIVTIGHDGKITLKRAGYEKGVTFTHQRLELLEDLLGEDSFRTLQNKLHYGYIQIVNAKLDGRVPSSILCIDQDFAKAFEDLCFFMKMWNEEGGEE